MKISLFIISLTILTTVTLQSQQENLRASDVGKCIQSALDLKKAVTKYIKEPGWFKGEDIGLIITHLKATLKYCRDADPDTLSYTFEEPEACKQTLIGIVGIVNEMKEVTLTADFDELSILINKLVQAILMAKDQCL